MLILLLFLIMPVSAFAYDDITSARYVRCYDGDTCTLMIEKVPDVFGKLIAIRLRGIDAPEIKGQCDAERISAKKAKALLIGLLSRADTLRLTDVHRDKYFRLNAVIVADGVNVNQALLELGAVVPYSGRVKKHQWCPTQ